MHSILSVQGKTTNEKNTKNAMCSDSARNHFRRELYLLLPLSREAETEAAAEAEEEAEAEAETTADAKVSYFFCSLA